MINTVMKNSAKALIISSALALTTVASAALPSQWQLDDSHTRVGFSVNHLGFSTTMGHFNDVKGTVNYDIKAPNKSSMDFTIATDSIDTNCDARDANPAAFVSCSNSRAHQRFDPQSQQSTGMDSAYANLQSRSLGFAATSCEAPCLS